MAKAEFDRDLWNATQVAAHRAERRPRLAAWYIEERAAVLSE